ncbi:thioesterase domain-containing protein [Mesorhizobium australicum]|uniref:thioesterase domain-containing protein n=1 Tax=Mesorhizobium australicum TaxID=536018 RepID=UPI00333CDE85
MPGADHGQGDRLGLLQTLGKLWTCGVRIDWSGLHDHKLEHHTPRGLATALSKTRGSARPNALVPIQTGGSRTPLFCPHPFGGHVLLYTPLAKALGTEQPFFGLQARGPNGEARPHLSIPEMAREYVEAMKSVQIHGPYQLAGLSMGGSIAWDMACQLHIAGDKVAIVGLARCQSASQA